MNTLLEAFKELNKLDKLRGSKSLKEDYSNNLDKDILTEGVRGILQDERKGIYHVCEIDGKVVGQIMYTYEWSDWRNGTFIWVQSVYVHQDYRGKGIFKALYNKVKEICDGSEEYVGIRLYEE